MKNSNSNDAIQPSASIAQKPMLPAVLSKSEAIKAMREGKKVTHRYFSNDEWITLTPTGMYLFEDGVVCPSLLFWQDRQGEYWETDWSEYGGYAQGLLSGFEFKNIKYGTDEQ